MKETQTAHSLLEEIAKLSSRERSGRLQLRAGDTRGAFFFRQGKLVDARVGPFTGYVALNLAVSITEPQLSFDPSIEPPPSRFRDLAERTLLRERFGIDTLESEVACQQPRIAENREHLFEPTPQGQRPGAILPNRQSTAAEKNEIEAISESAKSNRKVFSSFETNQFLTQASAVPLTTKPQQTQKTLDAVNHRTRVKRLLTFNTNERFVLRVGFIILVVIPAAVVSASYWTNGEQTSGLNASHPLRAEALLTPTSSHDAAAIPIIKTVRAEPPTLQRNAEVRVNEDLKTVRAESPTLPRNAEVRVNEDVKTRSLEAPDRKIKGTKSAPSDDTAMQRNLSDKPSSRTDQPSSRTVVVVVQITEGHVTEAYIQNPQVGLGAYESTALRMARERRYPKDTNRKDTVVLKVTERQKM
jgi:hypothetical protein